MRSSIRILSFSTDAGRGDSLAQVGLGRRPVINSKIALSKLIISATIDEARSSGSYENKADPHFQQDGIGEKAFALGSSGSSTKQTASTIVEIEKLRILIEDLTTPTDDRVPPFLRIVIWIVPIGTCDD